MPTVFVSHSSEDAKWVEQQIVPLLKSRNLNVWYSAESIQTAEEWERAIKRGLEACDWFLVALSPHSVKSKWVRRETGWAFANREGCIVPVLIETCDPNDLYLGLSELQFVDFRRDRQKGATRLLSMFEAHSAAAGSTPSAPEEGSAPRPGNFPLKALAHTQMLRGDFDEAIVELDGALELDPSPLVLASPGSASTTEDDYAEADEVIAQHCEREWPDDYSMRAYCIDQQRQAVENLRRGRSSEVPEDVFRQIRRKCAREWPDDYSMRLYAEEQQIAAYRKLHPAGR